MNDPASKQPTLGRRGFLGLAAAVLAGCESPGRVPQSQPAPKASGGGGESMNIIEFEDRLVTMRAENYRHPKIDILKTGFRPIGGKVADFAVAELNGRYHFYYIERRLQEGTPFYPGHETYFGHASTANFFDWEVHNPVLMVREGTWEDGHVWAPSIMKRGNEYVMAYTGVSRAISQDIGLASSTDLFNWKRWDSNPISPCKDRPWAHWHADHISSCRDPELFELDGKIGMIYTANTKTGASCIALSSTQDLKTWEDHGPILCGPTTGYRPRLEGGHQQGSLESAFILKKNGKWYLLVKTAMLHVPFHQWIIPSDRVDSFDFANGWEFWRGGICVQRVKDWGDRSLFAAMFAGSLKFGEIDWSVPSPIARTLETREELAAWQS